MGLLDFLKGLGKKKRYKGRNDWKHNHNKYGPKVATDGCEVLPSGAIVARTVESSPKTSKRR